jgi:hypothetical protein
MAMRGDRLVGTIGLIKSTWWYSDDEFLTNRWNFCIESQKNYGAGPALEAEAKALAQGTGFHSSPIIVLHGRRFRRLPRATAFEPGLTLRSEFEQSSLHECVRGGGHTSAGLNVELAATTRYASELSMRPPRGQ